MPSIRPLSLLLLLLAGCQTLPASAPTPAPTPVATPAGPAANDNLNAVVWFQSSVEYRLVAGQTWRSALAPLDKAIKTPDWDALAKEDRDTPARGLPPAIIVDVDETVLDNSIYEARQIRDNKEFDKASSQQWVDEQAATAVPGAVEFLQEAAHRGVVVFYISNRDVSQSTATFENLRRRGFPVTDASQLLFAGTVVPDCEQVGSAKACRRKLVGRTHRVLMLFGDQLGDLVNIPLNTPEGREQTIAPYLGWVGERWFVLPNPMYGSWLQSLYDKDTAKTPEERRRQIYQRLHY
jgi:acid phosphatase